MQRNAPKQRKDHARQPRPASSKAPARQSQRSAPRPAGKPQRPPRVGGARKAASGTAFKSRPYIAENDELIAPVTSSTTFEATAIEVNPGLAATFPWLSRIARNYEKYKFLSLEFYYKPRVSGFAATGQAGAMMLGFDYDSADPVPTVESNMSTRESYAEGPAYQVVKLRPNLRDLNNSLGKYIRSGPNVPGSDIKTYDVGQLFLGHTGFTAAAETGQLRVKYACQLMSAVLEDGAVIPATKTLSAIFNSTPLLPPDNIGTSTAIVLDEVEVNGIGMTTANNESWNFPPGNYAIDFTIEMRNETASTTDATTVQISMEVDGTVVATTGVDIVGPTASTGIISWIHRADGTPLPVQFLAQASFTGGAVELNSQLRAIACA